MLRALTLAALAALAPIGLAKADGVSDFYAGKSISLIISTGVGGGVDTNARLIAKHLGNHIPGNPGREPRHSREASAQAARDGTFLGAILPTFVGYQVLDGRGAQYDARNFNYLGSSDVENANLYTWSSLGVKRIEEVRTREVLMGATGAGSYTMLYPTLLNNMLGYKFKIVAGYPGTREINLAIEKGEVQGGCGETWSSVAATYPAWFRDKLVKPLVQESNVGYPELDRMGVPLSNAFAKTAEQKQILDLVYSQTTFGRPYVVAPGVPQERVEALRKAFMAAMTDPDLVAEAKRINLDIAPIPGEELQTLIARLYATPQEVVDKAKAALVYKP